VALVVAGCGQDDRAGGSEGSMAPATSAALESAADPDPYGPSHIDGLTIAELLEQTGVNTYGATTGLTERDWVDLSLAACATLDDPDAMLALAGEYGLLGLRPDAEIVISMNTFMGTACPSRFDN
jgi:hypothetical protein